MRAALVILVLLVLALAGLLIWQRQQAGPPPPPPPPAAGQAPASRNGGTEEARAARAVTSYLRGIYSQDYQKAYSLLSAGSREKHSYQQFAAACRQGATDFDLSAPPKLEKKADGTIVVTLSLAEEPSSHPFLTVLEKGQWKVVYLSGRPSFPYP